MIVAKDGDWATLEITVHSNAIAEAQLPPAMAANTRQQHVAEALADAIVRSGLPVQMEMTVEQEGAINVYRYRLPFMPERSVALEIVTERQRAVRAAEIEALTWASRLMAIEVEAAVSLATKKLIRRAMGKIDAKRMELEG